MTDPSMLHKPYTTGARPSSVAQKLNVTATSSGWVRVQDADSYKYSGNDNPATTPEVLVAIRNLAARLTPAISGFSWTSPVPPVPFDKSEGGNLRITAHFSQAVKVTGVPTLTVVNDQRANHTLLYISGTTTEELLFSLTIAANNAATSAGDILSVGVNAMAQAGGSTILAVSDDEAAAITNVAAIGTATGTVVVIA